MVRVFLSSTVAATLSSRNGVVAKVHTRHTISSSASTLVLASGNRAREFCEQSQQRRRDHACIYDVVDHRPRISVVPNIETILSKAAFTRSNINTVVHVVLVVLRRMYCIVLTKVRWMSASFLRRLFCPLSPRSGNQAGPLRPIVEGICFI